MPYNSNITRTDATALMPEDAAREVFTSSIEESAVLRVARRLPDLPRQVRRLPVIQTLPTAYFVGNKGDGDVSAAGLKQTTDVSWDNVYLYAEELAVVVPVPENVVNDSEYDIWGNIKPYLVQSFGAAIDAAILFGTNKPADWPTAIVTAAASAGHTVDLSNTEAGGNDLYDAVLGESGIYALVEADSYEPSANLAALSMRGRMRGLRDADGQPILVKDPSMAGGYALGGVPTVFPKNGGFDAATALMITGDWSQLVYAFRSDLSVKVFDTGVITDASNNVIFNLMQQDMVALRATMRIGFALPNPINPINTNGSTRYPFAVLTP